jgi:predicted flap endonuclease-1-like 5' DNA nuclease
MSFTINEIALLAVALLIGLVLGAMMGRGGKYKKRWRDEEVAHRAAIRDRDARLEAANTRIAELERNQGPIGPGTATAVAGAVHGRDELTRIRTVSASDEVALNEAGYHRYRQIAGMSDEQQATVEGRLGLRPGAITRDEWREQARLLDERKDDEHARIYDRRKTPV